MVVEVFGQDYCMACKATKRWLDENEIDYTYHDIQKDSVALDKVMALGYGGVPVVVTPNLHWQGFSLPNLKKLKRN